MKRILVAVLLLAAVGCGRNRFDHIDIAASERTLAALEEGFAAVPDSVPGGRTAYLLGQGVPVADVLVFAGEVGDSLFSLPALPFGYASESIGTELLLDSLHVKHNHLYSENGLNARVLYLQDSRMSMEMLNKLASLADGGAFIGGVKPAECLDPAEAAVFQRTADKVWLSGNVMSGKTLKSILKAAGVKPDVRAKKDSLIFQHRHLPHAEIYRIVNAGSYSGPLKLRFRVSGRQPLQWNPDTGEISPVSYKVKKRFTRVTFNTVPGDDTFFVFASFADKRKLKVK